MRHLGERLTAFVDGELGHGDRDRVLAHLAGCPDCRAEADALRGLKRRLYALPDGAPPDGLVERLRAMGEPGDPVPPRARPLPGTVRPRPATMPAGLSGPGAGRRTGTSRPGGAARTGDGRRPSAFRPPGRAGSPGRRLRGRLPRTRYVVAGAVSLAILGVGTASFAAGADTAQLPRIAPAIERFAVEHALTSGDVPLTDPNQGPAPGERP